MFDLDKEVAAWSEAVYAGRCSRAASVAELSDHLYCEIDRARAAGLADEPAFAAAVAKLGAAPALAAEDAKNRSRLGTAVAAVARYECARAGGRRNRPFFVAHGVVWAALMIAVSLGLSKAAVPELATWLLVGVLMPGWWASEQVLRRALRARAGA